MKKILLSCACCVLALGLVTACDNEEEEPEEPEVPGTVVDDGGSELATIKSGKLGLLYEESYHYLYFTGEVTEGFKGTLSESWSDGVNVTLAGTADSCYLSFEQNGSTVYIGGYTEENYFDMDVESTPYELKYDSTNDAILTTDGKYYLGAYNGEYLRWMSSTYLGNEGDYTAHIYSSAQTNPTAPELPDPAEWQVGESYLFGVNLTSEIQYIDGTTVGSYTYEGTLTSNASKAVHVTVGEAGESGDNAYTLSFVLSGETYYITIITTGEGDDIHTNLSYSTEEALIYWNETYGCWGNEEETHFLCYNSSYKCLYCSEIETWISSSPIAALYEITVLPAPTEMNITGPDIVYIGYTAQLAVEVDEGADASVTWEIADSNGEGTESATIDEETGLVHGVSEAEGLVVTATSAVEECDVSATSTIDVLSIVNPNVGTDTTYKLGAKDEANYEYRWFTGSTTGSTYLATSTSYSEGAEVYITSQADENDQDDTSCTLGFVDGEGQLKYICNNKSSTSVTIEDNPCVWVWDDTNGVFAMGTNLGTTSGGDRFLCYYANTPSFRAYAGTTSNLNQYPLVTAYSTEPEAMENPNAGLTATAVTSLTNGSSYYVGCVADEELGTYYLFDGGIYNESYLTSSIVLDNAVKVTATSVESSGWKFTFTLTEVEYTLYCYLNTVNSNTYCEISAVASSSLETTLSEKNSSGATATFGWDSEKNCVTATISSTTYYLAQNTNSSYAYEFGMYSKLGSGQSAISFYSSVTKAAEPE